MQIEQEKETKEVKVIKLKLSTFIIVVAILVITIATLGIIAKEHYALKAQYERNQEILTRQHEQNINNKK